MHRPAFLSILLIALAAPAAAAEPTLKRVLLSTGGVGYFEHEATVTGDATLTLEVRRDQVDDVLKSVVVYDDKGGVGTISLPGEEPLKAVFRELPFGPEALESPVALLNALRGAEVRAVGARELSGRLLSVTPETVELPDGRGAVTRHRASLMTASGLQQLILEETDSLRLADPRLQAQVEQALAALAQHGERDRRTLTIRTSGREERRVRIGYVVEAPLWKTSYRLTLPSGDSKAGDLQGWAVLENLSGTDWTGVELSVVSGNPVTFRQALYTAYYVNRPEVPVEVLGRVLPRPDEGGVVRDMVGQTMMQERAAGAPPPPASAPAPVPSAKMMAPAPTPRAAEPMAAESSEAATQVLFRYPQPVTVANGASLMLPIVARSVPAAPVDLYQPDTRARHPLASVRLTNDSGAGLPPGVLTLYERSAEGVSYIGDARLGALPAGEERLLSFALDQKVKVDRNEQPGQTISRATVVDGVLQLTVNDRQTTTYTLAGAAREPRSVVIEHPRRPGWELVAPAGANPEVTPGAYRLPVALAAGGTATVSVTLERPRLERIVLADMTVEQIGAYASARELPAPVREALAKLRTLRTALAERERRVADLENEQAGIVKDQERQRANLGALPANSDLYKRTIARMTEQETRIEKLQADAAAARKEADAARQALADYARGLKL